MMPVKNYDRLPKVAWVLCVLAISFYAYTLTTTYFTVKQSGTLTIRPSDSQAKIFISSNKTTVASVGRGSINTYLKPGTYVVSAVYNGLSDIKVVRVEKGKKQNVALTLGRGGLIHTLDDVTFSSFDVLDDDGLTSDQVYKLKELFFQFNTNAQTISINMGTITTDPYDPDVISITESLYFSCKIDQKEYFAHVSYEDFTDVDVQLYDREGGNLLYSTTSFPQS